MRVDASTAPIDQFELMVMVAPAFNPVSSMTTVSCASGKLATADAPPDVSAHAAADQKPPPTRFQYLLTPAANVMPLLPWQSPSRVPDQGADAPAAATSRKSTSDNAATAAAVSVLEAPNTTLRTSSLDVAVVVVPNVSVPRIVWLLFSART